MRCALGCSVWHWHFLMVFFGKWRVSKPESVLFIPAFCHWLHWCKPGKFSAEWGTLEVLLVGAGLLGSLPSSSGSPFVLEGSWKQGFQPRANPPTLSYLFQKNHSAYLSKRTRPVLLFHRKIWKGNRKLSCWVILQESGLLGKVEGRLCFPRCHS